MGKYFRRDPEILRFSKISKTSKSGFLKFRNFQKSRKFPDRNFLENTLDFQNFRRKYFPKNLKICFQFSKIKMFWWSKKITALKSSELSIQLIICVEILAQTWFYHPSMKMSPIIFVIFVGFQLVWGTLLPGLPPGPPASWEVPHSCQSWGCISRMVQQFVVWIKDSKKYKHSLAEKRNGVLKTAHSRTGYLWHLRWGGCGQDLQ